MDCADLITNVLNGAIVTYFDRINNKILIQ